MKLQILSDTHNSAYTLSDEADVIVHAGDFSNHLQGAIQFAELCQNMQKDFIFVLGNHDYYGSNYDDVMDFLQKNYADHALRADNCIQIQDKIFVGGTLFSNFRENRKSTTQILLEQHKKEAERCVYDFEKITIGKQHQHITAEKYIDLFQQHYQNIMQYKNQKNVVVVTHFPPHLACLDPYWSNHPIASALNPYFINNLDVDGFQLWISGHTHTAVDTMVDGCRLIVNPLGYPQEHRTNGFRENLLIEI